MKSNHKWRLSVIMSILVLATLVVIFRLYYFQILRGPELREYLDEFELVVANPDRGIIYDRNGAVLAANTAVYQVGATPNFILEPDNIATDLASILGIPRTDILARLNSDDQFVLFPEPISEEKALLIDSLDYSGIQIDPRPQRYYPQEELLCHTLGFVDYSMTGGSGLEGFYQNDLAGEAASTMAPISPLDRPESVIAHEGHDLVLTIDRSVQFLVETHLERALEVHGAVSGTIIVMDPNSGAILALANKPCFNPHLFFDLEELQELFEDGDDFNFVQNPAVSIVHEPGSIMKLITMASALDSGLWQPNSTYYDAGILEVGGHSTYNWDRSAPGQTDMTTLLARSLNVGAATLSTSLGPELYYDYMQAFGFGSPSGVDLLADSPGLMPLPDSSNWAPSFIATNAYGQGLAVTPLQMIRAVATVANGGRLVTPYIVAEIHADDGIIYHEQKPDFYPIRPETAQQVTTMAIAAVAREVSNAQVPGYTIAGKTGTAQISENGVYLDYEVIGSFVGWLPAEQPEIIIYIKLDRPRSAPWGSETAAPVFAELTEELVVLLDIPPDNIRNVLTANGGGQ